MYAQPAFRMDDARATAAFIEARRFATLVASGKTGPLAAHIPMLLVRNAEGDPTHLEGHVSKANPIADLAAQPVRALAIFHGADAYVTPSFYASKQEHGRVVPTWNYIAVEAAGMLEAFHDRAALHDQIYRLTDLMEDAAPSPWSVKDAPADYIDRLIGGVVGLRLDIASIEGVAKLSQNRPAADRAGVQAAFIRSSDPAANALARAMASSKDD